MPIDPYYRERFAAVDGFDRVRAASAEPEALARVARFRAEQGSWRVPELTIDDEVIEGRHGPIPVRWYRPHLAADPAVGTGASGTVLWMHGGGFYQGTLDWAEAHVVSAELADRAGVSVASVDYRLAEGGVRFPVPLDDVCDAAHGVMSAHPEGRFALGGASAGAALALGTALRLRDEGARLPDALALAYPLAHYPVPALDDEAAVVVRQMPPMLRFAPRHVDGIVRNYVGRLSSIPPLALPGHADLGGLPPVQLALAEFDELRPSGELLERQLGEQEVTVSTFLARGVPHGYLNRLPTAPRVNETLDFFASGLRLLLHGAALSGRA